MRRWRGIVWRLQVCHMPTDAAWWELMADAMRLLATVKQYLPPDKPNPFGTPPRAAIDQVLAKYQEMTMQPPVELG